MRARLRRFLHYLAADVLYSLGLLAAWRFFRRHLRREQEVYILGLHRVLTDQEYARTNSSDGMLLKEETFVELLAYLQDRFQVVSLDACLRGNAQEEGASKPLCTLTFDDGWRDTFTTAYPWLKRFHFPATIFLATGMVGSRAGFWSERLLKAWKDPSQHGGIREWLGRLGQRQGQTASLTEFVEYLKHMPAEDRRNILETLLPADKNGKYQPDVDQMLTWEQVLEMNRDGMAFGGHTVTHPLLVYEDDAIVEHELRASRQSLEERLHTTVRSFAYPNGNWDDRVRRQVVRAGYEYAFTTRPGRPRQQQDPYAIPRVLLHEGNVTGSDGKFSPAMFCLTLAGWA